MYKKVIVNNAEELYFWYNLSGENQKQEKNFMTTEQRKKLYRRAIDTWGDRAQLEMAQEEATELALAIRGLIRGKDKAMEALISEIADVEIMIEQIKYMSPHCVQAIESEKDFKLNRLSDRLDKKEFN